ncbi:MAG: hypothetical protein H6737_08655 [Alphaproteobacteria bacterium]|nr:hypothetical protein [Alphaproteobacteria bacterium]
MLFGSVAALVPFGMWREDRVLLVAGVAGLLLLAVCLALTLVAAVWTFLHTRASEPPPLELRVGSPGRTGFELWTPLWLPLVDVRWTMEAPDVELRLVARGRALVEQWTARRRGRPERVVRWFTAGDAFGLTSLSFPVESRQAIRFVPDEGALRQVEVVRGLASGDQIAHPEGRPEGDLMDIRAYGDGDPIRYVLWKVFAKSRTLVVRSPERALSPVRRTAAYLVAGEGDQAAAGTAKTAFECGALGDEWRFGADACHEVANERRGALEVVMSSAAGSAAASGDGLARFIAASDNPRRVVVFAPAVAGPWVDRVLDVARTTKLELVLCADDVVPSTGFGLTGLLLKPGEPPKAGSVVVSRDALAALVKRLGGVGTVRVVDRRSGHVFGAAHLSRLTGAA